MSEIKNYIVTLLEKNNFPLNKNQAAMLEKFVTEKSNVEGVKIIQEIQKRIMDNWKIKTKVYDIVNAQIIIPNGTVNKPYEAKLDFLKAGIKDNEIAYIEFENLSPYGLHYDDQSKTIKGTPIQNGDFKLKMKFRLHGEDESTEPNVKVISLVINADPKSLWKNIPSTQAENNYWKPDNVEDFKKIGSRHIVVASKRGRSHANVGSFRDDHFAFKHFETTGWSIVCVADGAGSAKLSRQGSKIACDTVIDYFSENTTAASLKEFDKVLLEHHSKSSAETAKSISHFVYNNLSKAAVAAHKKIEVFASQISHPIKDFHTTLIFTLFKKYDFGYAILTFGVGDCPVGLLNKEMTEIKLMNWLDVGEFGGGTRFITMPEIFSSEKFPTRFGFKLINDFSYLVLMTDGIYDPKFVVEANLEKIDKWKAFFDDLGGNNEEKVKVIFDPENKAIASQLSVWMDFWSPGNHDDRTLAIVF